MDAAGGLWLVAGSLAVIVSGMLLLRAKVHGRFFCKLMLLTVDTIQYIPRTCKSYQLSQLPAMQIWRETLNAAGTYQ